MSLFEVNLLKGRVLPPHRRKALYWSMLIYLALCGILLVTVVYTDTQRMIVAFDNMREASTIRKTFSKAYPGERDMIAFARSLREDMQASIARVDSIQNLVDGNAHLRRILLGLMAPMSHEVAIDDFRLDDKTKKLTLTLTVPEEHTHEAMDLIAMWNASTNLTREVTRFRALSRNESLLDGRAMVLVEVEGTLKGKGS